jgi:molybdate transport system substrate-binding protein
MQHTELKVLSGGAVKRGVAQRAADFERAAGARVAVEFAIAPRVRERVLAGEAVDVVVAPPAVMDELAQQGRIAAGTRALVGRARMGVFVRRGTPPPAIGSADAFRRALLAAEAVVYNQASSGLYMGRLLEKLGVAQALQGRIVQPPSGAAVMQHVAQDPRRALGVGQLSEIRVQLEKGLPLELVGPLPDDIQNVTVYQAAVAAASRSAEAAAALVRHLTSPEARAVFAATGID